VNKKEIIGHPLVSVIDDDESVRESLEDLLNELGCVAKTFSSGPEFLASGWVDLSQCLIVDISMPGMSGPDLYQELIKRGLKSQPSLSLLTSQPCALVCSKRVPWSAWPSRSATRRYSTHSRRRSANEPNLIWLICMN